MISDLYQELILDHNKNPRNQTELSNITHQAEGFNPLCGDEIELFLHVEANIIQDVSFKSNGCAISVASASIMSGLIKGLTIADATKLFDEFHSMVVEDGNVLEGKLAAFSGIKEYPSRIKCATMSWHALKSALKNNKS